jgi:hypothetical protein
MARPAQNQGPRPSEQLMPFTTGFMVPRRPYSVTKPGMPDLLKEGVKPVSERGPAEQTRTRSAVCCALASVGS